MNISNLNCYIESIEKSNFDECQKILKNKEVIICFKNFLDCLFNYHEYSPNILLTCFLISNHPQYLFEGEKDEKFIKNCVEVKNNILLFIKKINNYCIIDNGEIVYNLEYLREDNKQLIQYIKLYYCNFKKWKEKDEKDLINKLTQIFWELEMNIFSINISDKISEKEKENINLIRNKQDKIKQQIKSIGGTRGLDHFNNFIPLFINESYLNNLLKQITNNYHKAYWDILNEELQNNNFDGVLKILREIKILFKNLLPNDKKFHNELDEYIDIDFLDQLIKNNVFDNDNLHGIVNYIIENIKRLQSPSDDKDTENWEKTVIKKIDEGYSYEDFLPFFFKTVLEKLIKINNEVKMIKESKIYTNIKELKRNS